MRTSIATTRLNPLVTRIGGSRPALTQRDTGARPEEGGYTARQRYPSFWRKTDKKERAPAASATDSSLQEVHVSAAYRPPVERAARRDVGAFEGSSSRAWSKRRLKVWEYRRRGRNRCRRQRRHRPGGTRGPASAAGYGFASGCDSQMGFDTRSLVNLPIVPPLVPPLDDLDDFVWIRRLWDAMSRLQLVYMPTDRFRRCSTTQESQRQKRDKLAVGHFQKQDHLSWREELRIPHARLLDGRLVEREGGARRCRRESGSWSEEGPTIGARGRACTARSGFASGQLIFDVRAIVDWTVLSASRPLTSWMSLSGYTASATPCVVSKLRARTSIYRAPAQKEYRRRCTSCAPRILDAAHCSASP
ncbi:hypothetical protein C8R47DRAFT_1081838 [Mycena vitilis]|nr:hypothetical protein C8R47DRAFT_1081838 [Mycena vitilis]